MKRLLLAAIVLFASAGVAQAAPVRMVVRDVPLHGGRTLAAPAPRFNLVGIHWQGAGTPWFRTRSIGGRWSAWQAADDDWGRDGVWRKGNPVWTGAADAIQIRTVGRVDRAREFLLWSPPVPEAAERRLQIAGAPKIITRAGWQADESIRRAPPRYAPALKLAVVHHTVTSNGYSCARSASIVRGIEVYHVKGNGWDDIGYNFLVDGCGQVFEGRYGGVTRNVVGAHSGGFNSGTLGVSFIGTYTRAAPTQAAQDALVKLLAWRLDLAHIDPLSYADYRSGGNGKFAAGRIVHLRVVSGHRDTYLTECPGDALYRLLPALAKRVASSGGPKIYTPVVSGEVGGPVRFTAKLSGSAPWTVAVTDVTGVEVASWSDIGATVDWTWDSQFAVPGVAYRWTISATGARSAGGTLGGKLSTLALTELKVTPSLLAGAVPPPATVSFKLSAAATVTADLANSLGTVVAVVFSATRAAGAQSFVYSPANVPDGSYTLRVSARDTIGRTSRAAAPLTVSRALVSFSADTKLVSPNGDGRRDTATFRFGLAQPAVATLSLVGAEATFPVFTGELAPGLQSVTFAGRAADGSPIPDGQYQATIVVGAVKLALPLTIDNTPPVVTLVSVAPLMLRVYEQVTVIATVNGKLIRASKKAGVFELAKGESVESLSVVVRDAAGNESLPITYPVRRRR